MAVSTDVFYNVNQRGSSYEVDISLQSDFCVFVSESNMYLLDLKDNKIQCRTVERSNNVEDYVKYVEHMKHLHKSIFGSPKKEPHPLKRDFAVTIHYFQNTQPKKKLYCRNKDYYLVKKSFTEGVQYVKQGEMHIYKAIAKPLDIYISDRPLEPKTLKSNYDAFTISERISPGETETIPSNTYYIVIAPCHTYFKKVILDAFGFDDSTEISSSLSSEADFQVNSVSQYGTGSIASGRPNQAEALYMLGRMSMLSLLSGSTDEEHADSRHSLELEGDSDPEMVNSSSSKSSRSFETVIESKRGKSNTFLTRPSTALMDFSSVVPPSSNNLPVDMATIGNIEAVSRTSNLNILRAVFAIRKDGNIESYTIRSSDSNFRVLQDNILAGSFVIENNDVDPNVIEYHGDGHFIREIANFKNGSTLRNKLAVQKDLLDELQDATKKKEEVVVNYFYEFAFNAVEATYKTIEAAYRKFSIMRNIKMIGSCVPAIVPLSDTTFCGVVSDVYETKP